MCKHACQVNGKDLAPLEDYTDYSCTLVNDQHHRVVVGAREVFTSNSAYIVSRENGTLVENFAYFHTSEENGVDHQPGSLRNGSNGVNCIYVKNRTYFATPCTQLYNLHWCACKGRSP